MAKAIIAHPAQETTSSAEPQPAYILRGLGLVELHRDEILTGYQGGGRWLVPSGTETGKTYEVRVSTMRPERCRCECTGFQHHDHCSHLVAAERVARRSAVCDCCGERVWWSELVEVHEEDGLLAWFPGDRLCKTCVPGHWA